MVFAARLRIVRHELHMKTLFQQMRRGAGVMLGILAACQLPSAVSVAAEPDAADVEFFEKKSGPC